MSRLPINHSDLETLSSQMRNSERVAAGKAYELLHQADLYDWARLASLRRQAMHGATATYVVNLHINISNLCINRCRFCAFRREAEDSGSYELTAEQVWAMAEAKAPPGVTEFHLVSGLNPALNPRFCKRLLEGLRERFPHVHLKAFTAVEIDHLAKIENLPVPAILKELQASGLGSLTGGGAETLSPRVRELICPSKLDGEGYLSVHREAHRLGIPSTATLLFGHMETLQERLEHLLRLRALQDETGGFTCFIPLVFHPENTQLSHLPKADAATVLQMIAMSRVVLDNVPHIKSYWVSLGTRLAQIALHWGADDLDGTITQEQIHHSAGAATPQSLTPEALRYLITQAGMEPLERDSLYHMVKRGDKPVFRCEHAACVPQAESPHRKQAESLNHAGRIQRLSASEAERLLREGDLLELGMQARDMRMRLHPDSTVTYNIDRNINTTNQCQSLCAFCAFATPENSPTRWIITREEIAEKIDELYAHGGRQILMQGGMISALDLAWYESLFQWMRAQWPTLHIHALSPPEIQFLAKQAGVSWSETIDRLRSAGLDSIPGGGAEILCDAMRQRLSPRKCSADEWIGIMRTAHNLGMKTTATMVVGFGESPAQRIEHLERLRSLQDETHGFTAFIPWTFQPSRTPFEKQAIETSGMLPEEIRYHSLGAADYLRTLAVARLYLDNFDNLQASWVTQGRDVAQLALLFGANDMGSTMLEENVVAAAGVHFRMCREDLERMAEGIGFKALQRDFYYHS